MGVLGVDFNNQNDEVIQFDSPLALIGTEKIKDGLECFREKVMGDSI